MDSASLAAPVSAQRSSTRPAHAELTFEQERIRLLYSQLPLSLLGSLVAATVLGGMLIWLGTPRDALLAWYCAVVSLAAIRAGYLRAFKRATLDKHLVRVFMARFIWTNLASGLTWGALLLPVYARPADELLITLLVLGGLCAGAGTLYAPSRPAYAAFTGPIMASAMLTLAHLEHAVATVPLAILFLVMVSAGANQVCKAIGAALKLTIENRKLVDNLRSEQARIRELNSDLESRVQRRTTKLAEANERLREEIDEREAVQTALTDSEARYRALYDSNPSLFITLDARGRIKSLNDFGLNLLGYERTQIIDQPVTDLVDASMQDEMRMRLQECLDDLRSVHRWRISLTRSSGARLHFRAVAHALITAGDKRIFLVFEDITEAVALERKLRHGCSHDPVTGALNRVSIEAQGRRLSTHDGSDARRESAICLVEFKGLGAVNEKFDFTAGDTMLRNLAERIEKELRYGEMLGRVGDTAFVILMGRTDSGEAKARQQAVTAALGEYVFEWGKVRAQIPVHAAVLMLSDYGGRFDVSLRAARTLCRQALASREPRFQSPTVKAVAHMPDSPASGTASQTDLTATA